MEYYVLMITIAIVILICILTYVGMNMTSATAVAAFPPNSLICPDYWVLNDKEQCVASDRNLGKFRKGDMVDPKNINNTGMTSICAKREWANTNKVVWTGIDNYNKC